MNNTKKITGAALALVAAGLMGVSSISLAGKDHKDAKKMENVHCSGINKCKGKNDCKTAGNACKGKASCKGKGFVSMSASSCDHVGGKVTK